MIGPVGTWSGVSASEVVEEVADEVDKVGGVVGEVAEVLDAGVVTSSSPLKRSHPRLFQSKEWR